MTTNLGISLKRWEYQTTLPASWETCMQVKKHQLEPGMEQLTGSKLGKEYNKTAYLTYMQSTSCVMPSWMNHKQELKFPREKATASDMQIVLVQSLSHVRLCDIRDCSTPVICPSLSPRDRSDSCPLGRWCYLTISSSPAPFSFCLQSFPASGSSPMSQLFR